MILLNKLMSASGLTKAISYDPQKDLEIIEILDEQNIEELIPLLPELKEIQKQFSIKVSSESNNEFLILNIKLMSLIKRLEQ